MTPERAKELLAQCGAILFGHFVGTSGNHLSTYVAKDRATRLPSIVSALCLGIAERYADQNIEVVVAPAKGGIAYSQWTAHHLTLLRPDLPEVVAVYSEPMENTVGEAKRTMDFTFPNQVVELHAGDQVILREAAFVLKRGFDADVKGRRTLLVEDILTTGGSCRKTADAINAAGGILIGGGVLANGGNVTPEAAGVPRLEWLMAVGRQIFTEEECATHGLCAQNVPINTEFGHGKAFLAKHGR